MRGILRALRRLGPRLRAVQRRMRVRDRDRYIYYRVVLVQLKGGQNLERAVHNTAEMMPKNVLARQFGRRLEPLLGTGRPICSDWRESGWLPEMDGLLLELAEGREMLPETLQTLAQDAGAPLNSFASVIRPNLQYIGLFGIAMAFLWGFADLMGIVAGQYPDVLEGQIAYRASLWLREWWPTVVVASAGAAVAFSAACRGATGRLRRMLGPLVRNFDMRTGRMYLGAAERFAAQGLSFVETVDALRGVMRGRHIVSSLEHVAVQLGAGDNYYRALSGRVLPSEYAQTLERLAPSGDRSRVAEACRAVGDVMEDVLRDRYAGVAAGLKGGLLVANVVVLISLAFGMYSTTLDMTAQISSYRY